MPARDPVAASPRLLCPRGQKCCIFPSPNAAREPDKQTGTVTTCQVLDRSRWALRGRREGVKRRRGPEGEEEGRGEGEEERVWGKREGEGGRGWGEDRGRRREREGSSRVVKFKHLEPPLSLWKKTLHSPPRPPPPSMTEKHLTGRQALERGRRLDSGGSQGTVCV